jgi:hypothetical protein
MTDAIRPAPGVEAPAADETSIDNSEGDTSADAAGGETELHGTKSAASSDNGSSGEDYGGDSGDSAQWHRLPSGAMPVE